MAKKVDVIRPGRVVIPRNLLKKFEAESRSEIEFYFPSSPAGIMIFPDDILTKLGYAEIAKAGFKVVIMPPEGQMQM
jgi:bifunctional DNA-binding transcriptional regulator/antitoxin component of YhaV-PrlF toxin-antitoxin module